MCYRSQDTAAGTGRTTALALCKHFSHSRLHCLCLSNHLETLTTFASGGGGGSKADHTTKTVVPLQMYLFFSVLYVFVCAVQKHSRSLNNKALFQLSFV